MAINRRRFLALPAIGVPAMVVGKRLDILAWLKSYFSAFSGASPSAESIPKGLTTSSKFAMQDAFCRSKGYYRNALADENRP